MTARRVLLFIVVVPLLFVGFGLGAYFLAMNGAPRPPMAAPPVLYVPNSSLSVRGPGGLLEDAEDAASPRTPHTSTATLEAFVAERVAAEVAKVGDGDSVSVLEAGATPVTRLRLSDLLREPPYSLPVPDRNLPPFAERPAGETWVRLRWNGDAGTPVAWWPAPVRRGKLVANVAGPKGTATVIAELDEKPWLDTEPAAAGRPGYAVVSSVPLASEAEARAVVRRQASDLLVERLDARTRSMSPRGGRVEPDFLRRQAEAYVVAGHSTGGRMADEAVVRVDRPYGPVWYAAALVDARPESIEPLAREAMHFQVDRTRTIAATVVALPGMLLVLGAVYLGLNALTRGYFRGHLRAALVVGAIAVALAVVVLVA